MKLSRIEPPIDRRTQRYSAITYEAFRINESGRSDELRITGEPQSLEQALNSVLPLCLHKEKLAIRATSGGQAMLHLYDIKRKSQPLFVHENHATRRVYPLYAEQWATLNCSSAFPAASGASHPAPRNTVPAFEAGQGPQGDAA